MVEPVSRDDLGGDDQERARIGVQVPLAAEPAFDLHDQVVGPRVALGDVPVEAPDGREDAHAAPARAVDGPVALARRADVGELDTAAACRALVLGTVLEAGSAAIPRPPLTAALVARAMVGRAPWRRPLIVWLEQLCRVVRRRPAPKEVGRRRSGHLTKGATQRRPGCAPLIALRR